MTLEISCIHAVTISMTNRTRSNISDLKLDFYIKKTNYTLKYGPYDQNSMFIDMVGGDFVRSVTAWNMRYDGWCDFVRSVTTWNMNYGLYIPYKLREKLYILNKY